jgi:hypothetical protein
VIPPAFPRFVVSHVLVASFPQFAWHHSVSKQVHRHIQFHHFGVALADKKKELESDWNEQHKKLVKFKQKNDHHAVPEKKNKNDGSLGMWFSNQWATCAKNKMRPSDRKTPLDQLDFFLLVEH